MLDSMGGNSEKRSYFSTDRHSHHLPIRVLDSCARNTDTHPANKDWRCW